MEKFRCARLVDSTESLGLWSGKQSPGMVPPSEDWWGVGSVRNKLEYMYLVPFGEAGLALVASAVDW